MIAIISNLLLFFAETAHTRESGFTRFYNEYFNIPGFEVWKFLNLAIFVAIMTYLLKKPLGDAFHERREHVRAALIKAEEERLAALEKLTAAEAKLAQLEAEKQAILQKAQDEAAYERDRLAQQTEVEISRLVQQNEAELMRLSQQSRSELRRFSAEESIRLAEEKLRASIDAGTDARLVKAGIQEIGGLN